MSINLKKLDDEKYFGNIVEYKYIYMQLNTFTLFLLFVGMMFLIAKKCGLIDKLDDGRLASKKHHPVEIYDLNTMRGSNGPTGLLWR